MVERFLKFIPSEEAFWLMKNKPNAFYLLSQIANTARRTPGSADGLALGQCHLRHWSKYELTEQQYRTAKLILTGRKHIKIIETNRTRQKSTTGSTTASTLVEIISTTIYDINSECINDRINDRATTDQRLTNDRATTNKKEEERKEREEGKEEKDIAQSAKRLRSKDSLSFDFNSWSFTGITESDTTSWRVMYPHINLETETLKAADWIKANPSRSKKSRWRKFLTGWFNRNNETTENKKAYKSAAGSSGADRRTKDKSGNPIEIPGKEKF